MEDLLSIVHCADCYLIACGDHIIKNDVVRYENEHYEIFYLTGSFAVQNFTENYVDSSTFCSENFVQNSKFEENLSIRSRNKTGDSI